VIIVRGDKANRALREILSSDGELVQYGRLKDHKIMSEIETLQITTAVYGGESLGRLADGRAVFVPFALPGEMVRVRLTEDKRSHARAELIEIVRPSEQRIQARCRHFGVCGGCHYQHMPYETQCALKTAIVADQLQRIGHLANPVVQPIIACPDPFNYRNYVQFHLTSDGHLGYFTARGEHIFAIQECHLPEPLINQVWPQLDLVDTPDGSLPAESVAQNQLGVERVGLRLGVGDDLQLILEGREPQAPEFSVEELSLSAVYLSPAPALILAGSEAVTMDVSGRSFQVSAASFFQINRTMAAAMVEHVLAQANLPPNAVVIDVYSGVGLFSAFLAPRAQRLVAIESSASACDDFVANLNEFDVELYQATAEQVLPQLDLHPDLILVDPPRAGLDRRVLDAIVHLAAPQLIYVSCDPSTLARDAARLVAGGYLLQQITPFDMFPQTFHIESISIWKREP
jgi:23S rRNA (uracil1939-C5)-methyltransferase